jgi:hypothetical protein
MYVWNLGFLKAFNVKNVSSSDILVSDRMIVHKK